MEITKFPSDHDTTAFRDRFQPFRPGGRFILQVYGGTGNLAIWIADKDAPLDSTTAWTKFSTDLAANTPGGIVTDLEGSPAFQYFLGGDTIANRLTADPGSGTKAYYGEISVRQRSFVN